jgi:hypothetical protein
LSRHCRGLHRLSARITPQKVAAVTFQTDAPAGLIHVDVKYLPPLDRRRSDADVAIDRATRFVYLEIFFPIAGPPLRPGPSPVLP